MSSNICVIFTSICFGILCLGIAYRLLKGAGEIIEDAAEIIADDENNYYFTYGTDKQYPFILGWTRVSAPSYEAAVAAFKAFHPNRNGSGCINCADIYTEQQFNATSLPFEGNGGVFEHEYIRMTRLPKERKHEQC